MAQDKENVFQRLTRLFRSGPVVRKKIVSVDTSVAVPGRGKSSAARIFQRSVTPTYNQITNNTFSIQERLSRYQDYCFAGETLVSTLEGTFSLKELAEKYPNGEQFFVYSYDYETKQPTIGTAFYPRIARDGEKTKRVRVSLDDGGHIDVTPDHRFILRDGSTCEARDLAVGTSLMPLYVSDINGYGYNWVYMLGKHGYGKNGWQQEHALVARQFYGDIPIDCEVHHNDFNRSNNHPSNLTVMNEHVHRSYHAQLNNVRKFGKPNKKHSQWMKKNGNRNHSVTFKSIVEACNALNSTSFKDVCDFFDVAGSVIVLRVKEVGFKNWLDFKSRFSDAQALATHDIIVSETRSPEFHEITELVSSCQTLEELCAKLSCTRQAVFRRLDANGIRGWTELKTGVPYSGRKNGKVYSGPSYQTICDSFRRGMTKIELATACGTTHNKIGTCLKNNAFIAYSKWAVQQLNHKVASVTDIEDDVVYTVTVEKHHNLAVGSLNPSNDGKRRLSQVFATQCEMEMTPELNACLNLYADETCSSDEKGRVLHIYSTNSKIRSVLEDLFYNNLNIEFNLRPWVRNLCKYGDAFLLNDVDPELGVVNAVPIPVNHIERVENYDPNDPFAVKFRWVDKNKELDNWEVTHMRLLGNDMFLPYGSSVIEGARRIWRQLILIEDAMLTYRITRSPERRVFYIDIGAIPPDEVGHYMEQVKTTLRGALVADSTTGRTDQRYSPLSIEEDYFLPVRGTESGTRIDTLKGGENVGTVNDVEYIQKKLFAALQVPKAYLGFEEALGSKASLAQIDVRFSRTISMIQRTIISELNKLAMVHLAVAGYSDQDLVNFSLRLSNPSSVAQQQKLELIRSKFEIMGTSPEGLLSRDWLRLNVMGMTPEEIVQVEKEILDDAQGAAAREAASLGGGGETDEGMDLGGEDLSGGAPDMGGAPGGPPGGAPPLVGSEVVTAGESRGEDLVLAHDDPKDTTDAPIRLSMKDDDSPVRVQTHLDRLLYNKKRRRHNGSTTHGMPDLSRMTGNDTPEMRDPTDSSFMRSFSKLGAVSENKEYALHIDPFLSGDDPGLSQDLRHALERMKVKLESKKTKTATVLTENAEEIDLDDFDDTDLVEKG